MQCSKVSFEVFLKTLIFTQQISKCRDEKVCAALIAVDVQLCTGATLQVAMLFNSTATSFQRRPSLSAEGALFLGVLIKLCGQPLYFGGVSSALPSPVLAP